MGEQKKKRYVRRHTPAYVMAFQDSVGLWHFEYENGHTGDILDKSFHKLFVLVPEPIDTSPGAVRAAEEIHPAVDGEGWAYRKGSVADIAAIISKHTGGGKLEAALTHLVGIDDRDKCGSSDLAVTDTERIDAYHQARAAIADAQRTDGGED